MKTLLQRGWKGLLFSGLRSLLALAFIGPFFGRAGIRQILVLVVLLGLGGYLTGVLLTTIRPEEPRLAALGEGVFTAVALTPMAGLIGAEFGRAASLVLGVIIALLGLIWSPGGQKEPMAS